VKSGFWENNHDQPDGIEGAFIGPLHFAAPQEPAECCSWSRPSLSIDASGLLRAFEAITQQQKCHLLIQLTSASSFTPMDGWRRRFRPFSEDEPCSRDEDSHSSRSRARPRDVTGPPVTNTERFIQEEFEDLFHFCCDEVDHMTADATAKMQISRGF
jgi:hypothetical protein